MPLAGVVESGNFQILRGAGDAAPFRNVSGEAKTLADGKTYRSYRVGHGQPLKLADTGCDVREIQTFAGRHDPRASQAYGVWIASLRRQGLRTGSCHPAAGSVDRKDVVAVRLGLADGASGFTIGKSD